MRWLEADMTTWTVTWVANWTVQMPSWKFQLWESLLKMKMVFLSGCGHCLCNVQSPTAVHCNSQNSRCHSSVSHIILRHVFVYCCCLEAIIAFCRVNADRTLFVALEISTKRKVTSAIWFQVVAIATTLFGRLRLYTATARTTDAAEQFVKAHIGNAPHPTTAQMNKLVTSLTTNLMDLCQELLKSESPGLARTSVAQKTGLLLHKHSQFISHHSCSMCARQAQHSQAFIMLIIIYADPLITVNLIPSNQFRQNFVSC